MGDLPNTSTSFSNVEEIVTAVGSFGRFQKLYAVVLMGLLWFVCGSNTIAMVFLTEDIPLLVPSAGCLKQQDMLSSNDMIRQNASDVCIAEPADTHSMCDTSAFYSAPKGSVVSFFDLSRSACSLSATSHTENTKPFILRAIFSSPSIANSSFFLGFLVGVSGFGWLADAIGRRPAAFISLGVLEASSFASAFATTYAQFVMFRLSVGIGVGGCGLPCYILLTEITSAAYRPICTACHAVAFSLGGCFVSALGTFILSWRTLAIVNAVCGLAACTTCFLNVNIESPRWLAVNKKESESWRTWKYIAAVNGKTLPPDLAFGYDVASPNGGAEIEFESLPHEPGEIRHRRPSSKLSMSLSDEKPSDTSVPSTTAWAHVFDDASGDDDDTLHQASIYHDYGKDNDEVIGGTLKMSPSLKPSETKVTTTNFNAANYDQLQIGFHKDSLLRALLTRPVGRWAVACLLLWFASSIAYYGIVLDAGYIQHHTAHHEKSRLLFEEPTVDAHNGSRKHFHATPAQGYSGGDLQFVKSESRHPAKRGEDGENLGHKEANSKIKNWPKMVERERVEPSAPPFNLAERYNANSGKAHGPLENSIAYNATSKSSSPYNANGDFKTATELPPVSDGPHHITALEKLAPHVPVSATGGTSNHTLKRPTKSILSKEDISSLRSEALKNFWRSRRILSATTFFSFLIEVPLAFLAVFLVGVVPIGRRGVVLGGIFFGGVLCAGSFILTQLQFASYVISIVANSGRGLISMAFLILYLYSSELFPTSVRTGIVGLMSLGARIAGIAAPAAVELTEHFVAGGPLLLFAVCCCIAVAVGIQVLPDTLGHTLFDDVRELQKSGRESDVISFPFKFSPLQRWRERQLRTKYVGIPDTGISHESLDFTIGREQEMRGEEVELSVGDRFHLTANALDDDFGNAVSDSEFEGIERLSFLGGHFGMTDISGSPSLPFITGGMQIPVQSPIPVGVDRQRGPPEFNLLSINTRRVSDRRRSSLLHSSTLDENRHSDGHASRVLGDE